MTDSATRLRQARKGAGFSTAQEACDRFGWSYPTYSGHENGSRGFKTASAEEYARAFRVDLGWLITGNSRPRPASVDTSLGFAEPGMEIWTGRSDAVSSASHGLRHPAVYCATQDDPGFAVASGDLLVVEAQHDARAGDLVIANVADTNTGTAKRVLRRYLPPYLVGGSGFAGAPTTTDDANIVGTVQTLIRLLGGERA
jgi:transcriptional regulator with XRE-family HTH domain